MDKKRGKNKELEQLAEPSEAKTTLEQFLKSVKRFSDKNCGENKKLEQLGESSETKTALRQRSDSKIVTLTLILTIIFYYFGLSFAQAQTNQEADHGVTNPANIGTSGLPLPRFVSLRSGRVNVRVGPDSRVHAIAWTYTKQGLPVEIIEEYDNWRRIRDSDGDGGWVNQAFLSGKRTAMPAPWAEADSLNLRARPDEAATLIAKLEAGVIGDLRQCQQGWCELDIRAECDLIEPRGNTGSPFLPQFLIDMFSLGECSQNYRGWLKQNALWGVYPDEEI